MGRMDGGHGREDGGRRGWGNKPPHGVIFLLILSLSLSLLVQIKAREDGLGIGAALGVRLHDGVVGFL